MSVSEKRFFGEANTRSILQSVFITQQWVKHPWLRYRGLRGTDVERYAQLSDLLKDRIHELENNEPSHFHCGYGEILRRYYLELEEIVSISSELLKSPKTVYAHLKQARVVFGEYMQQTEPAAWHNIPSQHGSSYALETIFSRTIDTILGFVREMPRVGLLGLPNYRKSALASLSAKYAIAAHLVEACLWITPEESLSNYTKQVQYHMAQATRRWQPEAYVKSNFPSSRGLEEIAFLVVFDDVYDSIIDRDFADYLSQLPNRWKVLIVAQPWSHLPVDQVVSLEPLSREQVRLFVTLYSKERGLQESEITDALINKIEDETKGVIGEIDSIVERASRYPGDQKLKRALEELPSRYVAMNSVATKRIDKLPGRDFIHLAVIFPAPIRRSMFRYVLKLTDSEVDTQLAYLSDFKILVSTQSDCYSPRATWRAQLKDISLTGQSTTALLEAACDYFLGVFNNNVCSILLEFDEQNITALLTNLLNLGLPDRALELASFHADWLFDWVYERSRQECFSLLGILVKASKELNDTTSEIVFDVFRTHMMLRGSNISLAAYESAKNIEDRAAQLLNANNSDKTWLSLTRAKLGALRCQGYYYRNIGKYDDALSIFHQVNQEAELLHDELFNDVTQGMIATVLMRTCEARSIRQSIAILEEQIEWARFRRYHRRLAGSLGRMAEAYRLLAEIEPDNKIVTYQQAILYLEHCIEVDQNLKRNMFVGSNCRSLSNIYLHMAEIEPDRETASQYRTKAKQMFEIALPLLTQTGILYSEDIQTAWTLGLSLSDTS